MVVKFNEYVLIRLLITIIKYLFNFSILFFKLHSINYKVPMCYLFSAIIALVFLRTNVYIYIQVNR